MAFARPYALADGLAGALARILAWAGGLVLIALVAMTCLSVLGRALVPLGGAPLAGDFEMVELGIGFAVFSFLPWTQYAGAHARVGLFERAFGPRLSGLLDLAAEMLMAGAAVLLTWRLWLGMVDKRSYGETSMILQWPVWHAYAAGFAASVAWSFVALFCAVRAARALASHAAPASRLA